MVLEARLRVRHVGCFTEGITGNGHVTQIGGDRLHGVHVVHAATDAARKRILAAMSATAERVDIVERTPGAVVVRCHCKQDGVVAAILSYNCTILWPAVYARGTELYNVLAPTRDRLFALVDRLRDLGTVEVERVVEVPGDALNVAVPLFDIASDLTERQLAVLRRAIEQGYYASPRRVSADALAASFAVSRSTFQEHLRKAEARVLERFADVVASHPALLETASRRPGRRKALTPSPNGKRLDA